jgi:hypothetical protein
MPAFIATMVLFVALVTLAARACLRRNGDAIRCGTPSAMPVGWTPLPRQLAERLASMPAGPNLDKILTIACIIGAIFALIALMTRFDGEWDRQEGGDEERG